MKPKNWLILKRKVRFGDCDSAGVIHFHNLLRWSHESWEESIDIYGIPHQDIFPDANSNKNQIICPIVNCEANFLSPIKIGDLLTIKILPKKINNHLFQVNTIFFKDEIHVAEGKIIHCSLPFDSKLKVKLPDQLERWIEASNINTNLNNSGTLQSSATTIKALHTLEVLDSNLTAYLHLIVPALVGLIENLSLIHI